MTPQVPIKIVLLGLLLPVHLGFRTVQIVPKRASLLNTIKGLKRRSPIYCMVISLTLGRYQMELYIKLIDLASKVILESL